jgi:hypothetical protein
VTPVLSRLGGLRESRTALAAELGRRAGLRAAGTTEQPRRGQSTATIPLVDQMVERRGRNEILERRRRLLAVEPVEHLDVGAAVLSCATTERCHTEPTAVDGMLMGKETGQDLSP